MEAEDRPERLWVPGEAEGLEHLKHVEDVWPANRRVNFLIATCADKSAADCNMLDPEYLEPLYEKYYAAQTKVSLVS